MSYITRKPDAPPSRSVAEVGPGDYVKIGSRWERIAHNSAAGAERTPRDWSVRTESGASYGMWSINAYAKAEDMEQR